jgi:hypothetical protein
MSAVPVVGRLCKFKLSVEQLVCLLIALQVGLDYSRPCWPKFCSFLHLLKVAMHYGWIALPVMLDLFSMFLHWP